MQAYPTAADSHLPNPEHRKHIFPCRRRHHFFEGRPLQLFLLHTGYHALVLGGSCCLLAVFGQPLTARDSRGGSAAGALGAHQAEL